MKKRYYLSFLLNISILLIMQISASLAAEVPNSLFLIDNARIGVTTLDEIQKKYGINAPYRISKEEEADVEVCYFNSSSSGQAFLIFESGVMGSYKEIRGFRISAMHQNKKCKRINLEIRTLTTGNGIYLGQSLKEFEKNTLLNFSVVAQNYSMKS
jgi:hypothetical protein